MSPPSPSGISSASPIPANPTPIKEGSTSPNTVPIVSESLTSNSSSLSTQADPNINQELSDSLLTLDEFALELQDISADYLTHVDSIEGESLNEEVQTTQSILRLQ